MNDIAPAPLEKKIKKLQVKETILFAINNIPEVDPPTLEKFLELINATGTFGALSHEQIMTRMLQTLRYVPGSCAQSLLILADLLEIEIPSRRSLLTRPHAPHQLGSTHTGADQVSTRSIHNVH
jgi:hypothetical protein